MEGPFLEIHEADKVRQVFLGADPLTVGRHGDNRLALADTLASRFHCHISRSPNGAVMLRDLNSSNGTAVNGRLVKYTQLSPGDTVTIGHTKMIFLDPTAPSDNGHNGVEVVDLGRPKPAALRRDVDDVVDLGSPELLTDDDIVEDDELAPTDDEAIDVSLFEVEEVGASPEEQGAADELAGLGLRDTGQDAAPLDDLISMDDLVAPELSIGGDPKEAVEALVQSLPDQSFGVNDIALFSARGKLVHAAGSGPRDSYEAVGWLRLLLLLCCRSHATDIHFEPKGDDYVLRTRVDGLMVEICRVSNALGIRLSALVKVLGDIDIAQKNSIQEGHFSAQVPRARREDSPRIDYRVSFAPSVFGQKLVIRVLDTAYAPLHVRNLQLPDWMADEVERIIRQDSGMVLVCGPTGSGKTTTLYALIRGTGVTERNVITIEDPVEIQLEGVTQIPVDDTHDKSFGSLLRSTLRQDPDVILIGEIRDAETARIAMQAAITGHLVFSTVHAQNTTGTIFRLLDLGAEPYLVSQALHLVLAQRLVRQLCPACKQAVAPTAEQLKKMGPASANVKRIFEPRGCVRCLNTGFSGRRAIFELLTATDELRDLITKTPTAAQIYSALSSTPFQRLQTSGFDLVARGIAPFAEVDRIVGGDTR
jgi:type II secretory ATPase GspE/PulE/Tfp pilus assembly ATPase PilB-like protein